MFCNYLHGKTSLIDHQKPEALITGQIPKYTFMRFVTMY